MKRAAVALYALLRSVAAAVEGLFLAVGTGLLAVGASYFHPVGPWFVVGGVCLLLGLALAMPARRA